LARSRRHGQTGGSASSWSDIVPGLTLRTQRQVGSRGSFEALPTIADMRLKELPRATLQLQSCVFHISN
jgi:hypothetical protein